MYSPLCVLAGVRGTGGALLSSFPVSAHKTSWEPVCSLFPSWFPHKHRIPCNHCNVWVFPAIIGAAAIFL